MSAGKSEPGRRWPLVAVLAAPIVALDQTTKAAALTSFAQFPTPSTLVRGLCELHVRENHGAVGGVLSHGALPELPGLLGWAGIVLGLLLGWQGLRTPRCALRIRCALGCMLGGVLGNSIDRLDRGYVIDFLHLHVGTLLELGTLNVADLAIFAGLALLMPVLIRVPQWRPKPTS